MENLSRRQFLTTSGVLAVATLAPGRLLAALEQHAPPPVRVAQWTDIRGMFTLAPGYSHFATFFLASHPRPVRDAIEQFRRTIDANPALVVDHAMFESETENLQAKVAANVADYLGGKPGEVAITGNTTTSLALVYHGLPLHRGDEVLTTEHDHYSHHESIRFATERAGASMRRLALFQRPEDARTPEIAARIRRAIRPNTRVLGVTWVHSSSGVRLPIRAIAEVVAEANRKRPESEHVLLVVDGVHGLGAVDETIADMGCDFFCAGTHKWMFGPRGTGIIWATEKNWARLRPTIPSFSSLGAFQAWMDGVPPPQPVTAAQITPGGFTAFEHQWAMGAAFDLHRKLGRSRVAARIRQLNDQCKEGLAAIPNLTLHTPRDPELSAGLVAFEIAGQTPADIVKKLLARKIVASTSPYKVSYARLAPSLVNSPNEVDLAVRAVREIAGGA